MIDTHCHLLPGVDDGPRELRGALELARKLVEDGVGAVVATPHLSRRYPTPLVLARERLETLTAGLEAEGIALRVTLAAEVSPAMAVSEPLERLAERAAAGRFVLVEAEPSTPAGSFMAMHDRLASAGLVAVIAHPERCRAVQRAPSVLDAPRRAGARAQVVAPSLTGTWGAEVSACAWRLLATGRADLLASDAHGTAGRWPELGEAARLVERRFGQGARRELTQSAPAALAA